MSIYLEDYLPVVKHQGLNTAKAVDFSGASSVALPGGSTLGSATVLTLPTISGGLTATGSVSNDFSGSTGAFKTSTGAVTIGSGAISVTGAVTVASGIDITAAGGASDLDYSLSSGVFKTPTGVSTFGGSSNAFTAAITPTGGIAAGGGFTVTPRNIHTGNQPPLVSTDGTNLDVVTTETYISEVFVPCNMTVTGVAVFNGAAVAGNIQISLADSTGAPIAAALTASTAQSGTDAYQRVAFASPYAAKGPATYYVMVQGNNTGADLNAHTLGNFNAQKQTSQTYGTFTQITVAGTFTTAVGVMASLY